MFNKYISKIQCAGYQAQYDTAKELLESGETTYEELYEYLLDSLRKDDYFSSEYSAILDMLEGWCDPRWSLEQYKTRMQD